MTTGPASALEAAIDLQDRGDFAAAERLYRDLLAAKPDDIEALHNLGVLQLQTGRTDEALQVLGAARERAPRSAAIQADFATALNLLGRHGEAVAAYDDAVLLDRDRAESYYGLAIALQALRRLDEAIACLRRAIVLDADYAEAYCSLGRALCLKDRLPEAAAEYRRALAIAPDYAEAEEGLATTLHGLKKFDDAIVHYRRAIALNPAAAEAHNRMGLALDAVRRSEEALRCFDAAIAIRPDYGDAYANRGAVLQILGKIDAAQQSFRDGSRIEPARVRHYLNLANSGKMAADDPALGAMQGLAERIESLPSTEQIFLHFALGKALADIGDHDASFAHLRHGNMLKREQLRFDEAAELGLFERMRAVFTPSWLNRLQGAGHHSPAPIFIIGMPRSGSTLIEQMLASHPAVFGAGEREDFRAAVLEGGWDKAEAPFPESVREMPRAAAAALGLRYIERVAAAANMSPPPQRITDKTLMHFLVLGLICAALPKAHVIHIRRNPVDTCLSCYSKLFEEELPFTYDLGALGRYYRAYDRLMTYWDEVLPRGWILDVQYETLVEDFETQARRIVAHCGLAWDAACLRFHETERPVRTASSAQVRQPVNRGSIARRRPDEAFLKPLLEGLGPEPAGGAALGRRD